MFAAFFERGFGVPTGAFFRGLLEHYRIELVHLTPNSILSIAMFIHLCEAYLGISPHFELWKNLYHLVIQREDGKAKVVGGAGLQLRGGMRARYFDLKLKDLVRNWKEE